MDQSQRREFHSQLDIMLKLFLKIAKKARHKTLIEGFIEAKDRAQEMLVDQIPAE